MALADHPWLRPPQVPDYAQPNFQSYAVQLTGAAPIGRDELMQRLLDAGISTRRGIMLAHREPAYDSWPTRHALSSSEEASRRSLLLPLYAGMSDDEQEMVLRRLLARGPLVQQAQAGYSRGGE